MTLFKIQIVTIQIRGTIQNIRYYSISEYEQRTSTHQRVAQAPKLPTIQGTNYWMKATCVGSGYECVIVMRVISRVIFHS